MVFQERKTDTGFNYKVDDIFGVISIDSTTKLDAEKLDDLTVLLLKQGGSAEEVSGTVEHDAGTVSYHFTKRPTWAKADEKICDLTHTLMNETASGYTAKPHLLTRTLNWLQKFVAAFQEAWKKSR